MMSLIESWRLIASSATHPGKKHEITSISDEGAQNWPRHVKSGGAYTLSHQDGARSHPGFFEGPHQIATEILDQKLW